LEVVARALSDLEERTKEWEFLEMRPARNARGFVDISCVCLYCKIPYTGRVCAGTERILDILTSLFEG
jgi:hypothetical protein